jgi:hypothetical protein
MAWASPVERTKPVDTLALAYERDVSFQDGRTSSLIGWREHAVLSINGHPVSGDPDDPGPRSLCFSPVQPPSPEVMQQIEDFMRAGTGGYQGRYILNGSWSGSPNSPHTLTWSFVPDGLSIPGGAVSGEVTAPSVLFSRMDTLFGGTSNRAVWIAQIQSCFDRWASLSGVSYVRVRDTAGDDWDDGAAWGSAGSTNRGDIRISMHAIDGVNNVLAYSQFPTNGDIVMDSSENWGASGGNYLFLRNVIMHEHGHGLGFQHVCPTNETKLMEPFLSLAYDGPQQDDIRAVQVNYGDNYEPNNSPAAAYDLGTLAPGSTTNLGNVPAPAVTNGATLSISTATDTDYFKVNVADPRLTDITLTPVGSNYAMYPQSTCGSTTPNDNSLAVANLSLTVFNANGTTQLRSQDVNPAGSGEAISGLMLNSGINYVKVAGSGLTEAQLYKLSIVIRSTSLACNASDGTYSDHVHLSWPAIADAVGYQIYRNSSDATFGGTTLATITAPTATYDDTTATPGQLYYYFVKVQQPGNTGYRLMSDTGNTGYIDIPPTANAGPDQVVVDADNSGSEQVTLDGSLSTHAGEGSITAYRWFEGATFLTQSSSPTAIVTLAVGTHTITLVAVDNNGFTGSDTVVVNVVPPSTCDSADFNCDGDSGTDADIEAFFACVAGVCPQPPCMNSADFNHDGDSGTDADIEAFFRVLAGGHC